MKSIKDDFASLTNKLSTNARIDLYEKDYLHRIKWTFPLLLVSALISLSVFFSLGFINRMQLIILGVVSLVILLTVQLIARKACVAALKGDTIILRGINSKSTVTSIKSVRDANSFRLFGLQITWLKYTLDHQKRSSLLFGTPTGMKTSTDQLIRHAKKHEKK